jgi:hypothetical protein
MLTSMFTAVDPHDAEERPALRPVLDGAFTGDTSAGRSIG